MVILFLLAIDDGDDLEVTYLTGIYERIRADEFRPDTDHVSQVIKFDQTLVGKKPTLIAAHRRLVCYCRLYEIFDLTKRDKLTSHQREVYLFNDLLVVSASGRARERERNGESSLLGDQTVGQETSAIPASISSLRHESLFVRNTT